MRTSVFRSQKAEFESEQMICAANGAAFTVRDSYDDIVNVMDESLNVFELQRMECTGGQRG